jgi:hypothetical protein
VAAPNLADLEVALNATRSSRETTSGPLNNVITIDDERIKNHLDRIVRGSVEEALNALLEAEADRLCNAQRHERTGARRDPLQISSAGSRCLRKALEPALSSLAPSQMARNSHN